VISTVRARLVAGGVEFALSTIVAIAALVVALVFVVASGVSPGRAASAFVDGVFGTQLNVAGTLTLMVPLTMVALGWILVYRAGRFHVGFPGQIIFGGMFVSVVALKVSLPRPVHLPLALLAAMAGGALYAGIAAWLWAKRGVNEILSTLLLNLVAIQILAWWVRKPFHDPTTPLPLTRPLPESSRWPALLQDTSLHWDIVLVPVAIVVVAFLLARTTFGFRVRLVGANERMARYSGVSPTRVGTVAIVVSGALAGLAGSSLVLAGQTPAMGSDFAGNFGFTGIAVALLARNSPIGVLPAALLFAALQQGGGVMEATVGISSSLADFIQGLMIVLVLAATTVLYLVSQRLRTQRSGRTLAQPAPAFGAEGRP
jgi:simple sugar transport system permease protein